MSSSRDIHVHIVKSAILWRMSYLFCHAGYFPHDADALNEGRFGNAYFQPRVPSNPVVCTTDHVTCFS